VLLDQQEKLVVVFMERQDLRMLRTAGRLGTRYLRITAKYSDM